MFGLFPSSKQTVLIGQQSMCTNFISLLILTSYWHDFIMFEFIKRLFGGGKKSTQKEVTKNVDKIMEELYVYCKKI